MAQVGGIIIRTICCLALVCACVAVRTAAAAPARADVRIAFIPLESDAPVEQAIAVLEPTMLGHDGVRVVERGEIDKIMTERRLNLSLGADPAAWRDLSAVIPADLFVLIAPQSSEEGKSLLLRFVESRTGVIVGGSVIELEAIEPSIDSAAMEIGHAVQRTRVPDEQRVYLAFLGVRSDTPSRVIELKARMLSAVVQAQLVQNPAVTLLEREQMTLLTGERALSGIDLKLRAAGLILRGGLVQGENEQQMIVTLNAQRPNGGITTERVVVDLADLPQAAAAVSQAAATLANVQLDPVDTSVEQEAARLQRLSRLAISYTQHNVLSGETLTNPELYFDALTFAEAAYALHPVEEHLNGIILANLKLLDARLHPPLITRLTRWNSRLQVAELTLKRDRVRLQSGDASDDMFMFTRGFIGIPSPRAGDPQEADLWERTMRATLQHIDLLTAAVADRDASVRDAFHGTILHAAASVTVSPEDFCRFAIFHHQRADQAYRERVERRDERDKFLASAPAVLFRAGERGFRYSGDLAQYEPYLRFLEEHENPLARYYAYYTRISADPSLSLPLNRRIFDDMYDPQSDLNVYLDRLETRGIRASIPGWVAPFYPLRQGMGDEAFYGLCMEQLDRLEQAGAHRLLVRWAWLNARIIELAQRVDPDGVIDLVERIERAAHLTVDPPGLSLVDNRRTIANLLQKTRASTAQRLGPNLWDQYECTFYIAAENPPEGIAQGNHAYEMLDLLPGRHSTIELVALQPPRDGETGSYLLLMGASGGENSHLLHLFRIGHDLRERKRIGTFNPPLPFEMGLTFYPRAARDDRLVIGMQEHGLAVLDQQMQLYGEEQGAPSNHITALVWAGDTIVLACRGALAEFDMTTRRFKLIAAARSTDVRSPLDNTDNYNIRAMLHDPDEPRHIWFTVEPIGDRASRIRGVWRYDTQTGTLQQVEFVRVRWNPGLTHLAMIEGKLRVGRGGEMNYTIDRAAMTASHVDLKAFPPHRRRLYQMEEGVLVDEHAFSGQRLHDSEGRSHQGPFWGREFYLWPQGDRFTAVVNEGLVVVARKPGIAPPSSAGRKVVLWVLDDEVKEESSVYIHSDAVRAVPERTRLSSYLARYDFTLHPDDTVIVTCTDRKTGALAFWMADEQGHLLSYSRADMPVLPAEVKSKAQYVAQPPIEQWERARPITSKDLKPLHAVDGAPPQFPQDFSGIWLQSSNTGRCSVVVHAPGHE